jgi:hypothetical protein
MVVPVLNSDLGLAIGSQPRASSILADISQASTKFGGKHMAEGHQLGGLIGGITKHVTLITGTNLFWFLGEVAMDTLGDIGGLLLDVNKDFTVVSIETNIVRDEPNGPAGVTNDLLVVNIGLGGDLSEDHDHVGLGAGLAGNLAVRVLGKAGIENGIRDLVAELVGVALVDGLGGEKEGVGHCL